ncbi:MAG TPA: hypothetical protein PKJ23_16565, partial [bacterium]|nr:hypothetical protein [bacterium]
DGDGIPNGQDPDVDGDGILNGSDPDVDGDGINNGSDPDIDADGLANGSDPDTDGDGVLNGSDSDIDADGVNNNNDTDMDGDGTANISDSDANADGQDDGNEQGPDTDDDSDGTPDTDDTTPKGAGSNVSAQWNEHRLNAGWEHYTHPYTMHLRQSVTNSYPCRVNLTTYGNRVYLHNPSWNFTISPTSTRETATTVDLTDTSLDQGSKREVRYGKADGQSMNADLYTYTYKAKSVPVGLYRITWYTSQQQTASTAVTQPGANSSIQNAYNGYWLPYANVSFSAIENVAVTVPNSYIYSDNDMDVNLWETDDEEYVRLAIQSLPPNGNVQKYIAFLPGDVMLFGNECNGYERNGFCYISPGGEVGNTVAHEIGHSYGLNHVSDSDRLMNGSGSSGYMLKVSESGAANNNE